MDQELKQYLDANFSRLDEKFARIDERFSGIDKEFKEIHLNAQKLEERLKALIEKTETNLLGAFYGWARPMEVRVQGISTMVLGFDERLALAEQRISELERKRAS